MGIPNTDNTDNIPDSTIQPSETAHRHSHHSSRHRHKKPGAWRKFKHRIRKSIQNLFGKKKEETERPEFLKTERVSRRYYNAPKQTWWQRFRKNPWKTLFRRKKRGSSNSGYYYVHHFTKEERKAIRLKKRQQNRETFRIVISSPDLRKKLGMAFLQSTAYFVSSFMIIYLVYQAVTIAMASSFHIPVVWYYYKIDFILSDFSPLYTRTNLVLIFAAGPIVSLLLAFGFLRLYFTWNAFLKRFQLLFLWGFISGINMFFGAYIAGFFTQTEFIYTSAWLFMSHMFAVEEIIFTVISFAVLLIIGRIVTPLFLVASGTVKLMKPQFRIYYVISGIILPWFAGMIILFLVTLPNYYIPLVLKTITPVLILAPSLFRYNLVEYNNIHKMGVIQKNYFRWSILIAVVALLFFYRALLAFGLKFG